MLKVNDRLDRIAAARTNFTAHGILRDSCLVQAIKETLGNGDCDDENPMDEDDTSDSETSSESYDDRIQASPSNHTSVEDPNTNEVAPPNEEDYNCGPVKLGPLMNEVHLIARKGQSVPPLQVHRSLNFRSQHQRRNILHRLPPSV